MRLQRYRPTAAQRFHAAHPAVCQAQPRHLRVRHDLQVWPGADRLGQIAACGADPLFPVYRVRHGKKTIVRLLVDIVHERKSFILRDPPHGARERGPQRLWRAFDDMGPCLPTRAVTIVFDPAEIRQYRIPGKIPGSRARPTLIIRRHTA